MHSIWIFGSLCLMLKTMLPENVLCTSDNSMQLDTVQKLLKIDVVPYKTELFLLSSILKFSMAKNFVFYNHDYNTFYYI